MSNPETPRLLPGVRAETWWERVDRGFREIADTRPLDTRFSAEQNTQLMVSDAQVYADKEMFDEIHLMLRHLCEKK